MNKKRKEKEDNDKPKKQKMRSQSKPFTFKKQEFNKHYFQIKPKVKANLVNNRSNSNSSQYTKPPYVKYGSSPNIGSNKPKRNRYSSHPSLVLQPGGIIKCIKPIISNSKIHEPGDRYSPVYSLSSQISSKPSGSRNSNDSKKLDSIQSHKNTTIKQKEIKMTKLTKLINANHSYIMVAVQ